MASDERGFLVLGDVAIRRDDRPLVVFFHGFMTSPSSYRTVLTMLATDALVVAPRMYRPGPAVLAGRPSVIQEAEAAVGIVEQLVSEHGASDLSGSAVTAAVGRWHGSSPNASDPTA